MNRKEIWERTVTSLLFLCAASSIGIVLLIISNIVIEGAPVFIDWVLNGFGTKFIATSGQYGVIRLLATTLYTGIGATVVSAIIGVPAAIYLAEFSNSKIRNIIKPSMEMLVGIPSIVLGFFGLLVIVQFFINNFGFGESILAAWIVLSIMSLPHVATISEDAIRAVPNDYRYAALALGATKWQTVRHIILGSAKSGILASLLLALGNSIGETMAVFLVIGGRSNPIVSWDPTLPSNVLTRQITILVNEIGAAGDRSWNALFGMALILFIITFALNIVMTRVIRGKNKQSEI